MGFGDFPTPTGELNVRRVMNPSAIDLASVEYIVSNTCIAEAWKKVKSNKVKSGVDKINIEQFPKWVRPKWKLINKPVDTGSYQPTPVLRVEIPKEPSGKRLLGIPCVLDRVKDKGLMKLLGCFLRAGVVAILGTNSGLSNAHFEEIGLISIRTLWCKIHHPAMAQ